ncbi:DMT family transporter [Candidatus Bathyarchaeota archaeon]|nr:DMT family transporter [Candidatus Bathyarchaeota archaeon]
MVGQKALGALFGVLAGAMWALEAVLGKMLLSSLNFLQVAASESIFASLTSLVYILLTNKNLRVKRVHLKDILIIGLVGSFLAPIAYFLGLTLTFAVNATLLAHIQPLFVSFLGFFLLGERIRRNDVFGGLMIGVAAVLITGRSIENLLSLKFGNLGDLTVLFATFCWAIVAIPGKRLTKYINSVLIVFYRFLMASAAFIILLLILGEFTIGFASQVFLGVIVGLGYIFYYEGLKRLKASQAALTELSSPLFTALLAWFILGEYTTAMQIAGALLLLVGLVTLTREK